MSDEMVGPQGWLGSVEGEHRAFGEMGDSMPEMVCRHDAKKVLNDELLDETMDIQQENGIDDGFSFLHFCEAIFGEQLKWLPQIYGTCVGSGAMRVVSYRMLAEVFLLNEPEILPGIDIEGTDAFAPFAPFNYRGGRRRVGLNGGDGSMCGPHIRSQIEDGILTCDSGVQSDAYPEPQTSLYRKWGNSNSLHDQWKPTASKIKQTETEEVKSFDDLKTLLTEHHKPMMVCSSWGFSPSHKHPTWRLDNGDPVWIYKRQSVWQHNMSIVGCVEVDGDWFTIIENSWSANAHKNGRWFVVSESTMKSWIRSAAIMTIGDIDLVDQLPLFNRNKD